MNFPMINEIARYDDEKRAFRGFNHTMRCSEDEFYEMKNCTNQFYPAIAPRIKRGYPAQLSNPQCMCSLDKLYWIDDQKLYADGEEISWLGGVLETEKMIAMGAYLCLFPDGLVINTASKIPDIRKINTVNRHGTYASKFEISRKDGADVVYHDDAYYEDNDPENGDYLLTMINGKSVLKVYSSTTSTWTEVATAYIRITQDGIGENFKVGDGVNIQLDFLSRDAEESFSYAKNIFVNESRDYEHGTVMYDSNFVIQSKTDDSIVIVGLLDATHEFDAGQLKLTVERKLPDIAYVTECNNRLWACSKDGHEIYCCKLGDPTNWYAYEGISTDSWAVTIGSEGEFTGAITYMGYPLFFKENSFIKIAVSATGGHQLKETACRGVQKGSSKSLCMLNEMLLYKSENDIMSYSGNMPTQMNDVFGMVRYSDAVGGTLDGRYYLSMKSNDGKYSMFVYDYNVGCWTREDSTNAMEFCKHGNELYYIDSDSNKLVSVNGTFPDFAKEKVSEKNFEWILESANIDYRLNQSSPSQFMPTNKYIGRLNVRMQLAHGSSCDFYLKYDDGEWEHKFGMVGYGTQTYSIPVIPHRCDHFCYKIIGKGDGKILNITKAVEGGSDIYG